MADILPGQRVVAVSLSGQTAGQLTPEFYTPLHRAITKITAQIATLSQVVTAISDANGNLIASSSLVIDATELKAIQAIQGAGFTSRDPLGNWYARTLQAGAGLTITNSQGYGGDPIISAHGRKVIDFTFGDASPSPIYTILETSANVLLRIVIRTPFNGVGAALSLNAVSGPTLLASGAVAPSIAGGYEAAPDVVLVAGDVIQLVITPGSGATAGAGSIIVDTIPLLEN